LAHASFFSGETVNADMLNTCETEKVPTTMFMQLSVLETATTTPSKHKGPYLVAVYATVWSSIW
jgi:hypothetical protein